VLPLPGELPLGGGERVRMVPSPTWRRGGRHATSAPAPWVGRRRGSARNRPGGHAATEHPQDFRTVSRRRT
jgi:hypothetical protein